MFPRSTYQCGNRTAAGASSVINFNCVVPPFFTTTPNPTAASPSSSSASACYYSAPSSSFASPSRPESRASQLPPSPRDFSLEAHQAEYRAHAYLANESIVKTKLAADKFLQNLFKTQNEPDKDILRAASAASRARLQNPFAYNNSRSSGSSGSSSGSSGASSSYSGSSGSSGSSASSSSSYPRSSAGASNSSSNPSDLKTPAAPAAPEAAIEPSAADIDQPLTEADFTGCIKLEDAISSIESTAPRGTAILGGVPFDSTIPVAPDAKTPPRMAVPRPSVAHPNPVTPESTEAALTPEPSSSDLAILPFGNLAISPPPPPCLNLAAGPFQQFTTSSAGASWPLGP